MSPIRKLLFVGVGVLALYGVQACTSETELNPQPLPPQTGGGGDTRNPTDESDSEKNGSMGGSTTPAPSAADGGTEGGDAADAGDR